MSGEPTLDYVGFGASVGLIATSDSTLGVRTPNAESSMPFPVKRYVVESIGAIVVKV